MRFSLRTLLLVVTLAACFMGAAVWWRGHRQFCLSRAEYHESKMTTYGGGSYVNMTKEEFERAVRNAQARVTKENAERERLAATYRSAVWRPWLRLSVKEPQEADE
jgi:hypothetical protein